MKLKEILNLKIHINVIFYVGSKPKKLQYCPQCNNYREVILFESNHETCNICRNNKNDLTLQVIIREVCRESEIEPDEIHIESRERKYTEPRMESMYFATLLTNLTLSKIGRKIGDKDHSTVSFARTAINNLMDSDKHYKDRIDRLKKVIIKKIKT